MRTFALFCAFGFSAVLFSGCKKLDLDLRHHKPVNWETTTSEITIAKNSTLEYRLSAELSAHTPVISSQPANATSSVLVQDPLTGDWMLRYTPKTDYLGSDRVVIESENEEDESGHRGGKGNDDHMSCYGGDMDDDAHSRLVLTIQVTEKGTE